MFKVMRSNLFWLIAIIKFRFFYKIKNLRFYNTKTFTTLAKDDNDKILGEDFKILRKKILKSFMKTLSIKY